MPTHTSLLVHYQIHQQLSPAVQDSTHISSLQQECTGVHLYQYQFVGYTLAFLKSNNTLKNIHVTQ